MKTKGNPRLLPRFHHITLTTSNALLWTSQTELRCIAFDPRVPTVFMADEVGVY